MITGTIVPQKAMNFLSPELCTNALLQTMNTNPFTASCIQPAITAEPVNKFVKFAIKKKLNPVIPEINIHREFLKVNLPKSIPEFHISNFVQDMNTGADRGQLKIFCGAEVFSSASYKNIVALSTELVIFVEVATLKSHAEKVLKCVYNA